MNGPSRWQRVNSSAGSERPVRYGVGFSIACLALYILVMAGVRFYAHSIGVVGGYLTARRERRRLAHEAVIKRLNEVVGRDSVAPGTAA